MPEPKIEVLKSHDPESPQYTLKEMKHEINNLIDSGEFEHCIVICVGPKRRLMRFASDHTEGMTNADILWYLEMAKYYHLGFSPPY
jgi:hypothetical protein